MDPSAITKTRQSERDGHSDMQKRQAVALEQIADTLESLRIQLVMMGNTIGQIARKP